MTPVKPLALLLALTGATYAQADRFGVPDCSGSQLELADRTYFQLCYDASHKVASWVGYELKPEHLHGSASRPSHFRSDRELAHVSANDVDYRGSGYSRGHLAPALDFAWSERAINATFLLSNAAPQLQSVNTSVWVRVENWVRQVAAESDAVYVFTGVLFGDNPSTIGAGQVAVPSHFFKVFLAVSGAEKRMYAAIVPNARLGGQPVSAFLTTVNAVENLTGLDFFQALEDCEEERLENGEITDAGRFSGRSGPASKVLGRNQISGDRAGFSTNQRRGRN